ncbi:MAG: RidA family protein [Bacteroidota bacterium]
MRQLAILIVLAMLACQPATNSTSAPSEPVVRYDRPESSILKGVKVPRDRDLFFSSGLVTLPNDTTAPDRSLARYGDTYTQSIGCIKRVQSVLQEAGLDLKDVIYMGVFIAPNPEAEGKIEFDEWFRAYGEYFNNEENPTKVGRSTLGMAALARPYLLVEVEVIAVYPTETEDQIQ